MHGHSTTNVCPSKHLLGQRPPHPMRGPHSFDWKSDENRSRWMELHSTYKHHGQSFSFECSTSFLPSAPRYFSCSTHLMCTNISLSPTHDFAVKERALHGGMPLVNVEGNDGVDRPARRGTVMDRGKPADLAVSRFIGLRHSDAGTTRIKT